ncbi:MAG: alpha/beta hydrolase [Victivallales bacterium]|nr:alpha/beta hydrolase [Victivallales bacterium]
MKKAIFVLLLTLLFFLPSHGENTAEGLPPMQPSKEELTQRFVQLVNDGAFEKLLKRTTFNLSTQTLGGHFFWETTKAGNWRLQINAVFGNWRVLDDNDIRLAWGTSLEQLADFLADRPTSVLANYLDEGESFSHTPSPAPTGKTLFLIHGWGVRERSMQALANAMAEHGYDAYNYDYPTSRHTIQEHSDIFLDNLRKTIATLPSDEKLFFLTHSMGGLLLRTALAKMSEEECKRITAIVMLGPPNQGSYLAYLGKLPFVDEFNSSLGDMTPQENSHTMTIPAPPYLPPVCIIAGEHDGKVPLDKTHLPGNAETKHIIVPSTHPGLRVPENVLQHILEFFKQFGCEE